MAVVLDALTSLGFAGEAADIDEKWRMLLKIGGYKSNADYVRCFDKKLLRSIAEGAVAAYEAIACSNANSQAGKARIYDALNQGWKNLWSDPGGYAAWEKTMVTSLFPISTGQ